MPPHPCSRAHSLSHVRGKRRRQAVERLPWRRQKAAPHELVDWMAEEGHCAADLAEHACIVETESPYIDRWPLITESGKRHIKVRGNARVNNGEIARELALGDSVVFTGIRRQLRFPHLQRRVRSRERGRMRSRRRRLISRFLGGMSRRILGELAISHVLWYM